MVNIIIKIKEINDGYLLKLKSGDIFHFGTLGELQQAVAGFLEGYYQKPKVKEE